MVPFRATRWLTYGNDFDAMKTELCPVICTDVKFRVERQVVKLESRMITKYRNQLPLENFSVLSMEKGKRLGRQQVVLLINDDFSPHITV